MHTQSVQLANLEEVNITRETAKCDSEKAKQEMERITSNGAAHFTQRLVLLAGQEMHMHL